MTFRPLATRALPLAFALAFATRLSAQPSPIRIQDEPTCPKCTISLRVAATLDSPTDAVADRPWHVTTDKSGRYWMILESELPALYASSGKFLQSVGRKGAGPGEYQFAQYAIAVGDSVAVFDARNARMTVLDPSLKVVRSVVTPYQMLAPRVISWPDAVIVSRRQTGPRDIITPFAKVSLERQDATSKSFGDPWVFDPPHSPYGEGHLFAPSADGGVWTARTRAYQLAQWDKDGVLLEAFDRTSAWFPAEPPFRMGGPEKAPSAQVAGMERDASGLLWVFIQMPATTWKEAWPAGGGMEVMARKIRYEKMWTTRVEVIDPKAGRVVARQDFPRYMLNSLGNGRVAFFHRDPDDLAKTTIAQLTLVRP
jgi:hypothetical protein